MVPSPKEAVGKRGVEALEDWSTRAGDDTDLFVFSLLRRMDWRRHCETLLKRRTKNEGFIPTVTRHGMATG